MLVNCPRCGFTQPKDQYCAQCGVDMLAFRPPALPVWKKISGNPVIQLGLVLLIAAGGGYSIYRQRQSDLHERVRYLQGGAQIARSATSADSAVDFAERTEESASSGNEVALASADSADGVTKQLELKAADTISAPAASLQAAAQKAAQTAPENTAAFNKVRFTFAELNSRGMEQLFEESRGTGQFNQIGDHYAGLVGNLARKLVSTNTDLKILHQIERPIAPSPAQLFVGVHPGDPENELGFSIYIEKQDAEGGMMRGNLEIIRTWRERFSPAEPFVPQRKNYPALFELSNGSGFFMSGLLPTDGLRREDQGIVNVPPFQIFRSEAFRSGASEMVLFVEFTK
ncbi:MAG: hypothetical protein KF789_00500 [Bdellovibrionaceae bacterium]|nr:hypothetical protein [Pseudobdellovibrionaceae bacterium]